MLETLNMILLGLVIIYLIYENRRYICMKIRKRRDNVGNNEEAKREGIISEVDNIRVRGRQKYLRMGPKPQSSTTQSTHNTQSYPILPLVSTQPARETDSSLSNINSQLPNDPILTHNNNNNQMETSSINNQLILAKLTLATDTILYLKGILATHTNDIQILKDDLQYKDTLIRDNISQISNLKHEIQALNTRSKDIIYSKGQKRAQMRYSNPATPSLGDISIVESFTIDSPPPNMLKKQSKSSTNHRMNKFVNQKNNNTKLKLSTPVKAAQETHKKGKNLYRKIINRSNKIIMSKSEKNSPRANKLEISPWKETQKRIKTPNLNKKVSNNPLNLVEDSLEELKELEEFLGLEEESKLLVQEGRSIDIINNNKYKKGNNLTIITSPKGKMDVSHTLTRSYGKGEYRGNKMDKISKSIRYFSSPRFNAQNNEILNKRGNNSNINNSNNNINMDIKDVLDESGINNERSYQDKFEKKIKKEYKVAGKKEKKENASLNTINTLTTDTYTSRYNRPSSNEKNSNLPGKYVAFIPMKGEGTEQELERKRKSQLQHIKTHLNILKERKFSPSIYSIPNLCNLTYAYGAPAGAPASLEYLDSFSTEVLSTTPDAKQQNMTISVPPTEISPWKPIGNILSKPNTTKHSEQQMFTKRGGLFEEKVRKEREKMNAKVRWERMKALALESRRNIRLTNHKP